MWRTELGGQGGLSGDLGVWERDVDLGAGPHAWGDDRDTTGEQLLYGGTIGFCSLNALFSKPPRLRMKRSGYSLSSLFLKATSLAFGSLSLGKVCRLLGTFMSKSDFKPV